MTWVQIKDISVLVDQDNLNETVLADADTLRKLGVEIIHLEMSERHATMYIRFRDMPK